MDLRGRSYLKETDVTPAEYAGLLELAGHLRDEKRSGDERRRLTGRSIALIFEKTSTRTRAAFTVAVQDQGGFATYLGPGETQLIAFAAEYAGRWLMEATAADWAAPKGLRWFSVD